MCFGRGPVRGRQRELHAGRTDLDVGLDVGVFETGARLVGPRAFDLKVH